MLYARNARAGPAGSPGAFGERTVARQRGSRRKWGLCPAARPRRGCAPGLLPSVRARRARSAAPFLPRRPRARPPGAAGEHWAGGWGWRRRPCGVTLGSRPPRTGQDLAPASERRAPEAPRVPAQPPCHAEPRSPPPRSGALPAARAGLRPGRERAPSGSGRPGAVGAAPRLHPSDPPQPRRETGLDSRPFFRNERVQAKHKKNDMGYNEIPRAFSEQRRGGFQPGRCPRPGIGLTRGSAGRGGQRPPYLAVSQGIFVSFLVEEAFPGKCRCWVFFIILSRCARCPRCRAASSLLRLCC